MKENEIVDKINKENEKKWGKIKDCCQQYEPFCRCKKTTASIMLNKLKERGDIGCITVESLINLLEEVVKEEKTI